ncbi:MAG: NAD-dependent epimerase/dehydratase family protein [Methanosarcinales archaeon]
MKKVVITGTAGVIGSVLRKYLKKDYSLTLLDKTPLNERNFYLIDIAREYELLKEIVKGHDTIVHLAWDAREDIKSKIAIPENKMMAENVYKAALEVNVPKVIMASSIHTVGGYINWNKPPYSFIVKKEFDKLQNLSLISTDIEPLPDSPYAETKVYIERLGRIYSAKGLSVICVRFGGINPSNSPFTDEIGYSSIWLSHKDCAELIKKCIDVEKIPNNFLIIFGVSNNTYRIHDISNPLGWIPKDNAEKLC